MKNSHPSIRIVSVAFNAICLGLVLAAIADFLFDREFNRTYWYGALLAIVFSSVVVYRFGHGRVAQSVQLDQANNEKTVIWPYLILMLMLVATALFVFTDVFKSKLQVSALIAFLTACAGALVFSQHQRLHFSQWKIVGLTSIFISLEIFWIFVLSDMDA